MLGPSALRFYRGVTPPLPPGGYISSFGYTSALADVKGGPGGRRRSLRLPLGLDSGNTFLA